MTWIDNHWGTILLLVIGAGVVELFVLLSSAGGC